MAAFHYHRSGGIYCGVSVAVVLVVMLTCEAPLAAQEKSDARITARDKLWEQAQQLESQSRYREAASVGETMLALERIVLEEDSTELLDTITWLAATNEKGELWDAAKKYRDEAASWAEKRFGAAHWRARDARRRRDSLPKLQALPPAALADLAKANRLDLEALDLRLASRYGDAVEPARQAFELRRKVLGETQEDTVDALEGLASALQGSGKYVEAQRHYERVAELRRALLGEQHPQYALALDNLALEAVEAGRYRRAQELWERALSIRAEALGRDDVEYAATLRSLARLRQTFGDAAEARRLFEQSLAVFRAALVDNDPQIAVTLDDMGLAAIQDGDYARAEPLLRESLRVMKLAYGEESVDYAGVLENLATLHFSTGDLAQAEAAQLRCVEVYSRVFGVEHAYYATVASNLARIYLAARDYAKAEPLYRAALTIRRKQLGDDHPLTAAALNNLAALLADRGETAEAEALFRQALESHRKNLGERHYAYAHTLNNLASLTSRNGKPAEALRLFLQAMEIRKDVLGEFHPDYAMSLGNVAFQYFEMGDSTKAAEYFRRTLAVTRRLLEATAVVQSERGQLAMGQSLRFRLDGFISLAAADREFQKEAFAEVLAWKGATLVRQREIRAAADDPSVADLFRRLQDATRSLTAAGRAVPEGEGREAAWREQLTELTLEKERLEAELSRRSATFRRAVRGTMPEELVASLPADAALVDFLEYWRTTPDPREKERPTMVREFVAFIVRPAAEEAERIRLVALGASQPVAQAIDIWRESFGMSRQGVQAGAELRKAIWEPLLPALGDAQTILVATDGALGRLPLGALPGREPGKYLLEDHRLATIPVPQLLPALIHEEGKRELTRELLLIGDVDYEAAPDGTSTPTTKKKRPSRPGENRSITAASIDADRAPAGDVVFGRLANTAGEIAAIRDLYGRLYEVADDDPRALAQGDATEQSFRKFAGTYRHLHLATHGFFAAPDYQSAFESPAPSRAVGDGHRGGLVARDSPLIGFNPGLLSGLALAGANREPAAQTDDGILTSQEIAFLPLVGVDTVVLSACDTGLGETAGGEGLLGVQRAFQVAGARTTVAGYWKVDDLVTRQLMERFYRNLWEREMPRLDALREAELYILNHPEALRGVDPVSEEPTTRTSPRYWAAFGLSGDWR
ncbi:MAG: CHAT domain-containing protein [Planctomycetaceae bacterium]|nr:CHAT domain-containing protein [Planctomycetaceae bacterium]